MSRKTQKVVSTLFLTSCLLLSGGCIQDADAPRPQLAVELPFSRASSTQHQGPPLFCKAGRGTALFQSGWDEFPDTLFALYADERTNVKLTHMHGTEGIAIQAFFDHDGQKLVFCPVVDAAPGQRIACASIYVLDDDLNTGIKRTFNIPNALRGGAITCAYQQSHLKKLTSYSSGGN